MDKAITHTMKLNPVLDAKIQEIEAAEKQRKRRLAAFLRHKQHKPAKGRKEVIGRMIKNLQRQERARRKERKRPMYAPV